MKSVSTTQPILLVDDTPTNLSVLSATLAEAGYKVAVAVDGEGAIAQAHNTSPVLILLDVNMPGIDGFETCRRLKADAKTQEIPVIFMTALDNLAAKTKGFNVGAVDYITKPFQEGEVLARVNTHVELYQLRQQNQQLQQAMSDRLRVEVDLSRLNNDLEQEIQQRVTDLHTSEERLRLVIEATHDAIWDWDIIHNTVFRSPQIKGFLGLGSMTPDGEALVYEDLYERIHPEDRQKFEQGLRNQLDHDIPYRIELRIQRANGQYGWFLDQAILLRDNEGQPIRLVGALSDITSQKVAELAVRQLNADLEDRVKQRTAQLESVNQELESFVYSVSHDLRAPLRHIHGFVNALRTLLEQNARPLAQKVNHYLSVIDESSQKMGTLIDGLLLLSRVGRRTLRPQAVNLDDIARQAMDIARSSTLYECPDPIKWRIAPLPTVYGDAALIQQIFVNLMGNAIKFSHRNKPQEIEVGTTVEGIIFVKDHGVGFSMDYADKLFSPFERLHSKSDFSGTGIGLSIVQRIVYRHGGKIWAESQPGRGATFFFTLSLDLDQSTQSL